MDYDDKDAQDQNLHLVGEGSSKVSPVLRPYALPKFEFDDSLHGQLRFDSLVDNEVFLGITSQEDNHWIEEYSRGTSSIQFSSSAVELRPKNVWSEATSSESVEMLLKSVVQEEKVVEETIIEELEAQDRPDSLSNVMDPNEFQENLIGSNVSSDCKQSESHATFGSQSQETQISGGELDLVVIGDKYNTSVDEKKIDNICHDVNQEASKVANQPFVNELQEDPSVSQEIPERCIENDSSLSNNFYGSEPDHIIESKDNSIDKSTNSDTIVETCTNVESVDKLSVEGSVPVDEEPNDSLPIGSCDMQIAEEDNAHELNDNMHEQSIAVSSNGGHVEMQATEEVNTKSEILDCPKSNVEFLSNLSHARSHSVDETENGDGSDGQFEMGKTSTTAGPSAEMPAEDISNKDETSGNNAPKVHTGDINDETQSLEPDALSMDQDGAFNEKGDINDETQSLEPDALSMDQDDAFNEKGDGKLPLDYRDIDMDVVGASDNRKNDELSSSAEGCEGVIAMVQGSESNMAVLTDAVAAVESSEVSSHDTTDDVQLPSVTIETADNVTEDQPRSPILGVSLLHDDHEEKKVCDGSSQKGTLAEVDTTVEFELDGSSPVVEKVAVSDGADKVVHGQAGHCDPLVGNFDASLSEQTAVDNLGGLKCSKTLETSLFPCNSSVEGGNNAEAGVLLDPRESMTEEDGVEPPKLAVNISDEQQVCVDVAGLSDRDANCVVQNGGDSASLDKPQVVSFSDTKSIELSHHANDDHEVTPLSKTSKDTEGLQSVSSSGATKEEENVTFEVSARAGPQQTSIQNLSLSKDMKVSSISSSGSQSDPIKLHEDSLVNPQTPSTAANEAGSKKNSERKPRRKSVGRETAKKSNHLTENTSTRCPGRVEKSPGGNATPLKDPKPCGVLPNSTSNLPDLNNSTSLFQQSFTDNQQVQLRAQIFVYGSLISGMPPEEPHMIAAFGQADGGRRAWEAVWQACLDRVRAHKSQANNPGTPVQLRSGNKDHDQGIKIGSTQSKDLSPLTAGPSNMAISSPIVSPMIPISSPLWNIPTPFDYRQTVSPLHPFQTPRAQNFAGHNPSWLSQGPFPGQWVSSSPESAFSARFSPLPVTESVKLTTVKESGAVSAGPSVSPGPLSSLANMKKSMVLTGQPLSDSKSKKRKKVAQTEGNRMPFVVQNQTSSGMTTVVSSHSPTSAALSTPVPIKSTNNPGSFLSTSTIAHASTHGQLRHCDQIVTREEIVSKIEESKLQAADAALHAADAVSDCQNVWNHLESRKNSGLISDDEAKLGFSAVSIAAASSVAKVAAAAAKIASDVAEQARLAADEVFSSRRTESHGQTGQSSIVSTSIISAAREAARRRIEAASAASKHAENLDAIVKAAELAAEAVSQAEKIVRMGNPLPLRELVEAGPEGYWKQDHSDKQNVETASNDKKIQTSKHGLSLQEDSGDLVNNQMIVDGYENEKGTASKRVDQNVPQSTSDVDQNVPQSTSGTWKENIIKEGCLVEVCKDDNKNKGAWFAANVLALKDGKALVCYTEIQSDEGQLKEWVPLEIEGMEVPRIRIAHPMTTMRFEGTRKRGRTAVTDYAWCSGDRVDVWVQDRWCEAVVMETNKIDATSLTVQFSGKEETSVVRSWHVRPTLIWNDGKWTEWVSLKGRRSSEDDTPLEKRQKIGSTFVDGKQKDKLSNNIDIVESGRHQESKIPPSSAQGSSFNIGKSSSDKNKLNTNRTMKSGLQKERSKVVFGVPTPGKKQKFIDMSKHYVGDKSNKNNTPNDLMSHGSKNSSKDDAEIKSKVLKSRKPPVPSLGRTLAQKDKSKSSKPMSRDAFTSDKIMKDSVGVDENLLSHQNRMNFGSSSNTKNEIEGPKETSTSKAISQRLNKGKNASGDRKTGKVEVKEKSTSEAEPRRSNRRIQPTSRLLEGLQSSLTVSRIPTTNANQRSHNKVASKGSTNPGRENES